MPANPETKIRCDWVTKDPLYIDYHDNEWGKLVHDDRVMYEFLVLEAFQAGLSWLTVLRKRENFRKAFAGFDPKRVSKFTQTDIDRLLTDAGIIRNKAKIKAAIINARAFLQVQQEFGTFSEYLWAFTNGKTIKNILITDDDYPDKSELSEKISKDLKKRGFSFLGPVVVYSHLQAMGIVNDHQQKCFLA